MPTWIVETPNVPKDFRPNLLPCFINSLFDFFTLQITEELFSHCVAAATPSAHGLSYWVFLAPAAELINAKMRTLIRL
jgi:hypothetical protein